MSSDLHFLHLCLLHCIVNQPRGISLTHRGRQDEGYSVAFSRTRRGKEKKRRKEKSLEEGGEDAERKRLERGIHGRMRKEEIE